jgi:hypothetical protein
MPSVINATTTAGVAVTGDNSGALALQTNNGTTAVTIDTSQNVGIGTTSPDGKLTIETVNSNTPRIRFQNSSFDGDAAISTFVSSTGTDLVLGSNTYINSSGNLARFDSAQAGSYVYANRGGNLFFGTNDTSGVATERMRITSGGYTKCSDNATYISSTGLYHEMMTSRVDSYALRVGVTANSGGGYPLQLCWVNQTNNNTTDRYLTCSDATNTKLQIFSNGNVQNLNGSYGTISDIKNKENIVDATPKLDKVIQLKVRNFNLKDDETKLKQIGFIAQEFEEIFPSMIEESPDVDIDGNKTGEITKAIKTSVLVPILVKALQELNAKVEAQAVRIAELEGAK